MGELEPEDRITIKRKGDSQEYVLVQPRRLDELEACEEELVQIARELDCAKDRGHPHHGDPGVWSQGHIHLQVEELLERAEDAPEDLERLAELMNNWDRHITLQRPPGVSISYDPDKYEGDGKPSLKVALSDELQALLERLGGESNDDDTA